MWTVLFGGPIGRTSDVSRLQHNPDLTDAFKHSALSWRSVGFILELNSRRLVDNSAAQLSDSLVDVEHGGQRDQSVGSGLGPG